MDSTPGTGRSGEWMLPGDGKEGSSDQVWIPALEDGGPRGPAVIMLVLSATGAPLALVKRFDPDMANTPWMS